MRRTKIVATLGPATREPAPMTELIETGVDVVRLNFAHDTPEAHERAAHQVRSLARSMNRIVGVLVDLPGPKMRSGEVAGDEVHLETGARFEVTERNEMGSSRRVSTSVDGLAGMVAEGDEIFLADGAIVLRVESVDDESVVTEVIRGGLLRSRKGMHLPGAERHVQAFTEADHQALTFALALEADLVGLSFIRDAEDVARARAALPKKGPRPMLVAKIETRSALGCLDDIVAEADAVMVARGDLGIQAPLRDVPMLQKEIIRVCNRHGVPVITATQMLESMTDAPLPTRAEVSDVANAVLDGTDALMLSEETAVGSYPALTVQTMADVAVAAERQVRHHACPETSDMSVDRVSWAVAHAAVQAATDVGVAAILCPTRSGSTARRVAAFRPPMPIVGISALPDTLGAMALGWGVTPLETDDQPQAPDLRGEVDRATAAATRAGLVAPGDLVAVVAGGPGRRVGRTDFLRVVRA